MDEIDRIRHPDPERYAMMLNCGSFGTMIRTLATPGRQKVVRRDRGYAIMSPEDELAYRENQIAMLLSFPVRPYLRDVDAAKTLIPDGFRLEVNEVLQGQFLATLVPVKVKARQHEAFPPIPYPPFTKLRGHPLPVAISIAALQQQLDAYVRLHHIDPNDSLAKYDFFPSSKIIAAHLQARISKSLIDDIARRKQHGCLDELNARIAEALNVEV